MTRRLLVPTLALTVGLALLVASPGSALSRKGELYSAWVPSLCGHHSGRLVKGRLPGIPSGEGQVSIFTRSLVQLGRLTRGKRDWGAMVVSCDQGGVAWPENVAFYHPNGSYAGVRRLFDVTKGGREYVRKIWISKRTVKVEVVGIDQGDEAACCGTKSALLHFRWDNGKQRIVTSYKHLFTERTALRGLLKAVNHGHRKQARRHASKRVVKNLFWMRGAGLGPLRAGRCYGDADPRMGYYVNLNQRGCDIKDRHGVTGVLMTHSRWNAFMARRMLYGHD